MTDAESFEADLWDGIAESKRLGYNPTRFIQMVKQFGAVEATRMVVDTRYPAEGFVKLAWDMVPRRPDLTSEQLVLNHANLFSDDLVRKARERLGHT
ncbi:hypothetical protein [Mycobacterium simiae]|uniref:hypothetical protein n=1 Tax=Mycobacterium simiae TaxID=1784 RepID=UPI0004075E03|nr:hypothetical protein [Mycobacterium simiae]PLV48011.1 hypothetical protein X011_17715 [Mycobacterium tuberculosis variant microti OV254]BBX43926.1 hypothetical protein MSIM_53770 [Mycobacterium simiae]